MAINKVVYGSTTLLDLTSDTVTAQHLENGYTAHDANGEPIIGTLNPGSGNSQLIFSPITISCNHMASIAYSEVENDFGGKTFIIGGENGGIQ